jgi:hypothetical protein
VLERKRCRTCGVRFEGQHWQRQCTDCYKAAKREEADRAFTEAYLLGAREAFKHWDDQVRPLLKRAVRLCHPDRHPTERFDEANSLTVDLLALQRLIEKHDG